MMMRSREEERPALTHTRQHHERDETDRRARRHKTTHARTRARTQRGTVTRLCTRNNFFFLFFSSPRFFFFHFTSCVYEYHKVELYR